MGYRSHFYISLAGGDPSIYEDVFGEIGKESGYKLEDFGGGQAAVNDANWGNMQKDLTAVAKRHPELVIEVNVEGEDRDDNWKRRFKGTETECVSMTYGWPPFKRILLPFKEEQTETPPKKTYVASLIEVTDDGMVFATLHADEDPRKVADGIVSDLETEQSERSLDILYDPDDIFVTVINGTVHSGPEIIETKQSARFHLATDVQTR